MPEPLQLHGLKVAGANVPVYEAPGHVADGVAFGELDGDVFITITKDGLAQYVRLTGDQIDFVAGLFGDAIAAATISVVPTMGSVQ